MAKKTIRALYNQDEFMRIIANATLDKHGDGFCGPADDVMVFTMRNADGEVIQCRCEITYDTDRNQV